jgi:tetratricopeptide (TPR) repeat protein
MDKTISPKIDDKKSAADYLREVKTHLLKERRREAYALVQSAVGKYADDPMLLSYYGYLKACMDSRYRSGIEDCLRALSLFQRNALRGEGDMDETAKSEFYLNLGRAYCAANKKKLAYDALNKGLKFDKQNVALQKELQKMGVRKLPPIPFLDRSNPINAILGKMIRKNEKRSILL